jgi:predicted enzyme related to lactoylglutathione lyase
MDRNRNPVGWFEIYVRDMRRAKAFYEAVLGVELQALDSTAGGVDVVLAFPMRDGAPGAAGGLVLMEGGPSGGGASTIVYFTSDDCAVELRRVVAYGGSIKKDKTSIGEHGFIALAQDSEGNVIGLHSLK